MEKQNNKNTNINNKIKSSDFIYLITTLFVIIIITVMFFYTTKFIINSLNKILISNKEVKSQALDYSKYSLLEKKLNLPDNNSPISTTPATQVVIPTTEIKVATTTILLDKKSITIDIINAARKSGVAISLSNDLEKAGFIKSKTESKKSSPNPTTILIKDSKKDYTSYIEEVVKSKYPNAITKSNPEKSKFDVIITISK